MEPSATPHDVKGDDCHAQHLQLFGGPTVGANPAAGSVMVLDTSTRSEIDQWICRSQSAKDRGEDDTEEFLDKGRRLLLLLKPTASEEI